MNTLTAQDDQAIYAADPFRTREDAVLAEAIQILQARMKKTTEAFTSPAAVTQYLTIKLAELEHEIFGVLLLDNSHRLIEDQVMFRGTVDGAHVYPREVIKEVLSVNAAAVIFYHNHPSGNLTPSRTDEAITAKLIDALRLIEVRVLDHFIVGGMNTYSFADHGLI